MNLISGAQAWTWGPMLLPQAAGGDTNTLMFSEGRLLITLNLVDACAILYRRVILHTQVTVIFPCYLQWHKTNEHPSTLRVCETDREGRGKAHRWILFATRTSGRKRITLILELSFVKEKKKSRDLETQISIPWSRETLSQCGFSLRWDWSLLCTGVATPRLYNEHSTRQPETEFQFQRGNKQ